MPPVRPVELRRASPADFTALHELAARLGACELTPWRTPDEIVGADERAMAAAVHRRDRDNEVFIAERGGAAVGCLHMVAATDFFGRRHAHVSVISVAAEVEGSGVGRALLAHAERWADERGLTLITLNVFAGNTRARSFYEQAGYRPEFVKYAKQLTGGARDAAIGGAGD